MKKITSKAAFVVLIVFFSACVQARSNGWPKLNSKASDIQCSEAMQLAEATFRSNSFYLYAPLSVPEDFRSKPALEPSGLDLSGGDALKEDSAIFDKLPMDMAGVSPRSIYWQKTSTHGQRLVVQEKPHGWRGDMYSLFLISEKIKPDAFLAEARIDHKNKTYLPIISDSWRPPLVFLEKKTGQPWVVDVGQPYYILSDWQVYVVGSEGMQLRCTIQFRPNLKNVKTVLPEAVRTLASLLDKTIGPGNNEGTLQPTARLRTEVAHTWANVAFRPWALPQPYNGRAEVDEGLLKWSRHGSAYKKIYQKILIQYPIAEHALTNYYRKNFRLPTDEAKSMALNALDVAFRANFIFPRE